MTTPGKRESQRTPQRNDSKEIEERDTVNNPSTGSELEDDLGDDDELQDEIPQPSVDDQETGRMDRDGNVPSGGRNRS